MAHSEMCTNRADGRLRFRRASNERGQAVAETGIVITVLVLLTIGVVEFGRAFNIVNVLTHALRDAARQAAVVGASNRSSSGTINSTSTQAVAARVKTIMASVVDSATANSISVTVSQQVENGINTVKVTASGTIPYTFGIVGPSFTVNRSISFVDEGKTS